MLEVEEKGGEDDLKREESSRKQEEWGLEGGKHHPSLFAFTASPSCLISADESPPFCQRRRL